MPPRRGYRAHLLDHFNVRIIDRVVWLAGPNAPVVSRGPIVRYSSLAMNASTQPDDNSSGGLNGHDADDGTQHSQPAIRVEPGDCESSERCAMDRRPVLMMFAVAISISGCSATQVQLCSSSGPSGCSHNVSPDSCTSTPCGCVPQSEGCTTADSCNGCTADEGCNHHRRKRLAGGFERGRDNLLLDGAGWITGIPSKLLLWNTKVDNHSVSPETEQQLRRYLAARGLSDVKVRINQYDPIGEWKRLADNKDIHAGWRYTVGALVVTRYTLLPGRLFGNDEYNPFTHSISLYSDRPSIALRGGAHAYSAVNSPYRGLYSASAYLPGAPLWVDPPATRDVLAYSRETNQRTLERESYLVLYPAFGARVAQSLTFFADAGHGSAAQGGFALIGHAVGRTMAMRVSDTPLQMVKSAYGIVKRKQPDAETAPPRDTAEAQNPLPPVEEIDVTFIPIEVTYDFMKEQG